jgi:hypothetical protein
VALSPKGIQAMPNHAIAVPWPRNKQSVYRTRYLEAKSNKQNEINNKSTQEDKKKKKKVE